MRSVLLWGVLLSFCSVAHVSAQKTSDVVEGLKASVVKISSPNRTLLGAGLVVGQRGKTVYVVTARHVVVDNNNKALDFGVTFYRRSDAGFSGRLLNAKADIDIALIAVDLPDDIVASVSFRKVGESRHAEPDAKVIVIGHPYNEAWYWNALNQLDMQAYVSNTGDHTHDLRLSNDRLEVGDSGGPLLDEGGDLIGIILEITAINAFAVRFDQVRQLLNETKVTANLVETRPAGPLRPCPTFWNRYLIGELLAAAASTGIAFRENNALSDKKAQLDSIPSRDLADNAEFNRQLSEAHDLEGKRNLWRAVAVGAGTTGVAYSSHRFLAWRACAAERSTIASPSWSAVVDPARRAIRVTVVF